MSSSSSRAGLTFHAPREPLRNSAVVVIGSDVVAEGRFLAGAGGWDHVSLSLGADEGARLDAGHVRWVSASEIAGEKILVTYRLSHCRIRSARDSES